MILQTLGKLLIADDFTDQNQRAHRFGNGCIKGGTLPDSRIWRGALDGGAVVTAITEQTPTPQKQPIAKWHSIPSGTLAEDR